MRMVCCKDALLEGTDLTLGGKGSLLNLLSRSGRYQRNIMKERQKMI
jgi:hypothetical protein